MCALLIEKESARKSANCQTRQSPGSLRGLSSYSTSANPDNLKLSHYLFSGSGALGVETIESCEGGPGHAFPEPTVRVRWRKERGLPSLIRNLHHGRLFES